MRLDPWQPLSPPPPVALQVWWLTLEGLPEAVWQRWPALLDDAERDRATRFYHERDRRQFIAAHALLRTLLQVRAGLPASAWRFVTGAHGKPALHPDHGLERLQFNISHTPGAVACAMAQDFPVGVDIEDMQRPGRLVEIAESYFAPAELARLRAAAAADQRALFFRLWTLKEAYIKAHGHGLSLPLDQFAFDPGPVPRIAFAPGIMDDPAAWSFATMAASDTHMLSVAIRHGGRNEIAVRARRVTHLAIDRPDTMPDAVPATPAIRGALE